MPPICGRGPITFVTGVMECHNGFNIYDGNCSLVIHEEDQDEREFLIEHGKYTLSELSSVLENKLKLLNPTRKKQQQRTPLNSETKICL